MEYKQITDKYLLLNLVTERMILSLNQDDLESFFDLKDEHDVIIRELDGYDVLRTLNDLNEDNKSTISSHLEQILVNENIIKGLIENKKGMLSKLIGDTITQDSQLRSYNSIADLI